MDNTLNQQLLDHLLTFVSDNKRQLFDKVIDNRTRYLTVVLEDIFQPHNASAVLRTCDCFGIQDVHIIENVNQYEVIPDVALGASKWLNIYRYNRHDVNTLHCIQQLKNRGYRIVATTPHKDGYNIDELPVSQKTALLFGTERMGLSDEALSLSDAFVKIPMLGFTESFNISVSAALFLYHLSTKLRAENIDWQLHNNERLSIKLDWVRQVVKASAEIEERFLKQIVGGQKLDS
jgi:tRNA (guanosine-2'-O-)-methyltransferase